MVPAKSPQIEIGAFVALALEGEHGVRPGVDAALNPAREVHAKKGKFRIGHGIDESADQVLSLGNQIVVFSAKGHDPDFRLLSCHPADAITVQSGTIDHVFGGERSAGGLDHHFRALADHFLNFCSGVYGAALRGHNFRVFSGDSRVVRNSRAWHHKSQQAAAMRLDFAQLFALQHAQSDQTVGLTPLQQFLKAVESHLQLVATMTLPQISCFKLCSRQNSTMAAAPSTQSFAFRDPGL